MIEFSKLKCYQAKSMLEINIKLFSEKKADVVIFHEVIGPFKTNYLYFAESQKTEAIKSLLSWEVYDTMIPDLFCFLVPGEISEPVKDLSSISIQTEIL